MRPQNGVFAAMEGDRCRLRAELEAVSLIEIYESESREPAVVFTCACVTIRLVINTHHELQAGTRALVEEA